ncbi:MAG TPA: rhomboid family intramembrane serine protease [Saprospiraceae bacterium]|nr:rhomboid family intramembrane serine protease [Saprospiraceae bacterium]HNG88926.1 rhomboid family intramembrane serine protease [Saprospiraceae bacterium]
MAVTYLIIGFTSLISIMAFQQVDLMVKMRHWPFYEKRDREYYRWITCGFLHGDYLHLMFNMLTLYFFGLFLESWFDAQFGGMGKTLFVLFYLVSLAASSSATYFKYRETPSYASIGASGAVAAVMFATILIEPLMTLRFMFLPMPIKGFIFGILYLWYSSYAAKQSHDNIDHTAHFYGAVFGFFFPMVLEPDLLPQFIGQVLTWVQSLFG